MSSTHVTAAQIEGWLDLLNLPSFNVEPRSIYYEHQRVRQREIGYSTYDIAAGQWPSFAEQYWEQIRSQALLLFTTPRSFNFVQWVLQSARAYWPNRFGLDCHDATPEVELTDALCNGTLSPLHLAATFGLQRLSKELVRRGADVNQASPYGTPLSCALEGLSALEPRPASAPKYSSSPRDGIHDRGRLVQYLCQKKADGAYRCLLPGRRTTSLAGSAFDLAFHERDSAIFECVVRVGARVDNELGKSIRALKLHPTHLDSVGSSLAQLLTLAFDMTWLHDKGDAWDLDFLTQSILQCMRKHNLEFTVNPSRGSKIRQIDDNFHEKLEGAVLGGATHHLARMVIDPRFDAKALTKSSSRNHCSLRDMAIGADDVAMVKVMLGAGVDFRCSDRQGRSPVLLVESAEMLESLISYGLPTTDTDNENRTIWHYAAVTNDIRLTEWLLSHDPSKLRNAISKDKRGLTPLDVALLSIHNGPPEEQRVFGEPILRCKPHSRLVRELLKVGSRCVTASSFPLVLMAVAWNDLALVSSLISMGADPRAHDKHGRSALHCLNLSVKAELINLLQERCQGLDVAVGGDGGARHTSFTFWPDDITFDLTPVETTFVNTFTFLAQSPNPGHRANCRHLSRKAYNLLLTPQVIAFRDREGLDAWGRFCRRLLPLHDRLAEANPNELSSFTLALKTAQTCLIKRGVVSSYEQERQGAAILCLKEDNNRWTASRLPFVQHHVYSYSSSLSDRLYLSDEARMLQRAAEDLKSPILLQTIRERIAEAQASVPANATC